MSRSTLTTFLLIVTFGILFAGCAKAEPDKSFEEFTFSDTDLQKIEELSSGGGSTGSGILPPVGITSSDESGSIPAFSVIGSSGSTVLTDNAAITIDKEKQKLYENVRKSLTDQGGNIYRVNNPFLNVRRAMDGGSELIVQLNSGNIVTVTEIPDAEWAKVKLTDGKEGFVAFRYLAKPTTEQRLAEEKKQFEGKYFVDYAFLNIRKDPSTQAEKIGELPGQTIIKPLSMNAQWARVVYNGKEGYVSTQYLKLFLPVFLVRGEEYSLPLLRYSADDSSAVGILPKHVAALKTAGKKIMTLRALYDTVIAQETKDARISPDTVVLIVEGVTSKNVKLVSDALQNAGVSATLFIQTRDIGLAGITEKTILNLLANGNDLQSGGHTGDDLRSMTDSQVMLELGQSKKLIQDLTHKEVFAISYPKGGVNDRVMQQAAVIGYLFGISQSPDSRFSRSQFLRLPTLLVTGGMTGDDVLKLAK